MKVVVPLAGIDKNFESRGICKPLIDVEGKPAIQWISESRPYSYKNAIFILLREQQKKYNIDVELKKLFGEDIKIVWSEELTGGAPHSVLLAEEFINNDDELIIDLPDQYLDLDGLMEFIKNNSDSPGICPTFKSSYWNRGYMLIGADGNIKKVSEKDKPPISTDGITGVTYFKYGKDFVWGAKEMIKKDRRCANGAFLISPVYNELIERGDKVLPYPIEFIGNLGSYEGAISFIQYLRPLKWKTN
ncbi:hypothetical protein GOV12_07950 [Candidatus Pacearchaeota archaeon]|nr:hypothetical protein [Candidatus Pacearchaeota archaeon]